MVEARDSQLKVRKEQEEYGGGQGQPVEGQEQSGGGQDSQV
jgi:hypothetical protein